MTSEPEAQQPAPQRSHRRFAVAAVAVALAGLLVVTAGGIGENLVYYWGPKEIHAAGTDAVGATIRLGGQVAEDSIVFGTGASELEFDVIADGQRVHVKARGVPPQMFREGIGVVVEGTMTADGYFDGRRLLVSHGNDYQAPESGAPVDMKRMIEGAEATGGDPASR